MKLKKSFEPDVEKNKKPECNEETGFCSPLADRLEGVAHKGKGFTQLAVLSGDALKLKIVGVCYKTGGSDKGLMLNFCPFCGSKIDWFRKIEIPEKVGK